jgi:hypothetical protein
MIYVLKLKNGRYFVMKSSDKSDVHILFEAEMLYEFPKLYLPESVHERHTEESPLDLDRYVKYYMVWVGIENVRGGSYLNPILPDYQQRTLLDEMNTAIHEPDLIGEDIIAYANETHTKEEVRSRLAEIKKNYVKYKAEEKMKISIDLPLIRSELQWLKTECENQRSAFIENRTTTFLFQLEKIEIIKRYRKLLSLLKMVKHIIIDVLDLPMKDPEIKYPEFVFDDYIYHHHRIHISPDKLNCIINEYNHLLNIIENRKAERDFDIASWGKNPERDMPREIYMLKRICRGPANR